MTTLSLRQKILALAFYEAYSRQQPQAERHSYYSYFDALERLYSLVGNEFYKEFFRSMSRNNWYETARQKAFKEAVQARTVDRYKKIDEAAPCAMTEEQARQFATSSFYEEARQHSQRYAPLSRTAINVSRPAIAQALARDNWKYDYTEVISIDFDKAAIEQAQAEMPEIVTAIKAALAANEEQQLLFSSH